MPKVSVIVPVYNAAQLIEKTLDSLQEQTYQDMEVLLVDDGSTDKTLTLIESWIGAANDQRFKVLHKTNGGVSDARNFGIQHAEGDYLIFIDGDDQQRPDLVERYVETIEKSGDDVSFFEIERLALTGESEGVTGFQTNNVVLGSDLLVLLGSQQVSGYPWAYISKRSLWHNVQFDTKLKFYEDLAVLASLVNRTPDMRIGFNQGVYYYYVQHENSALHSMSFTDFEDFVTVANHLLQVANRLELPKQMCRQIRGQLLSAHLSTALIALFWNMDEEYNRARRLFMQTLPHVGFANPKTQLKRYIQYGLFLLNGRKIIKKIYDKSYVV